MSYKFCPNCGFKLEGDYKFCPSCGGPLSNSSPTPKADEPKVETSESDELGLLLSAFNEKMGGTEEGEAEREARLGEIEKYIGYGVTELAERKSRRLIKKYPFFYEGYYGLVRALSDGFASFSNEGLDEAMRLFKSKSSSFQNKLPAARDEQYRAFSRKKGELDEERRWSEAVKRKYGLSFVASDLIEFGYYPSKEGCSKQAKDGMAFNKHISVEGGQAVINAPDGRRYLAGHIYWRVLKKDGDIYTLAPTVPLFCPRMDGDNLFYSTSELSPWEAHGKKSCHDRICEYLFSETQLSLLGKERSTGALFRVPTVEEYEVFHEVLDGEWRDLPFVNHTSMSLEETYFKDVPDGPKPILLRKAAGGSHRGDFKICLGDCGKVTDYKKDYCYFVPIVDLILPLI